ncbi:alpha/beta hydrolase [Streptomyces sp. NPDC005963]|uniref:alpha/beta hydrolase n=1 Tax=Streptomyces sp. NPDC005963 TaxID=3156721 RepID=UPI0033EA8A1B
MISPYFLKAGGLGLSGRISGRTSRPRGLVVTLHGGTYDSAYYDIDSASLLSLAPALDLCVVALDRPGYGSARGSESALQSFDGQAAVLQSALKRLSDDVQPAHGTVLVGHSIGGMIALTLAARGTPGLRGVEVSGIGEVWRPGLREMWNSFIGSDPFVEVPPEPHADVMLGPQGSYMPTRRALDADLVRPMPMPELIDAVRWSELFPTVAADIDVPVGLTFAEHDNIWMSDEPARSLAASRFIKAPSLNVDLVTTAGHCIELHNRSRSYCLRQLAFIEDCLTA